MNEFPNGSTMSFSIFEYLSKNGINIRTTEAKVKQRKLY